MGVLVQIMWGPSHPAGSGTKPVGARLTPRVLGQNMWGPVSPRGFWDKHVGARINPTESPPEQSGGSGTKNTRGSSAKIDRTPLADRIGLQGPLLAILPAEPTPTPRWAPSRCYSHPPSPNLYLNKCVYHCIPIGQLGEHKITAG